MRAVGINEYGGSDRLILMELPDPRPGPGELLLKVECALSCGTDLKAFRRGHPMWPMPAPFGHEFAGVVAEAGPGVADFKVGDDVMAAPTAPPNVAGTTPRSSGACSASPSPVCSVT